MKVLADYCERPVPAVTIFFSFCSVLYVALYRGDGMSDRTFLCWRILQDANDLVQLAEALTGDEREWLENASEQIQSVLVHRSAVTEPKLANSETSVRAA